MLKNKIFKLIKEGEGLCIEFKECNTEISKGVYETVCAFLNRNGGELLLGVTDQATPQATPQADRINTIVSFCLEPKSRGEIQTFLNIKDREYFRLEILKPLLEKRLLFFTIPGKPNSPKQKYYSKIKRG